jgi:NadR type nicotinamide-nucleotide adenylyltransferase
MSEAAVRRVAILGAESSGKSTLAEALAAHYATLWVPEYLREFVDVNQRVPFEHEQILIGTTQRAREAQATADAAARSYVFCDTTPLMTAIYSRYCFGKVDAPLALLAQSQRYDVTLVAAPDCPWIADGLQRVSDAARQAIHAIVVQTLADMGIDYLLVDGALAQRMATVTAYLRRLDALE